MIAVSYTSRNMQNDLQFRFNPRKAIEAILWVATRRPEGVDYYKILKTLLDADVYHLNTYGRILTGDQYVAMAHGPVPDYAYQIIKGELLAVHDLGEIPFSVGDKSMVCPKRPPEMDQLSESDVEALEHGWMRCKDLSFNELHALYADHPAYKKVWEHKSTGSDLINIADFLEDKTSLEELKELAPRLQI